jgi:hypothetical protein
MRIGRLKYECDGKREGNLGEDIFVKSIGQPVTDCTWKTWRQFDVVLISIPSTFHYEALLNGFYKYGFEYRGKTKVVIGGFAAINPFLLFGYFDLWVWGRCRDVSAEVIDSAVSGNVLDYAATPKEIIEGTPKIIRQEPLYDCEEFTGCPYRCKFCQYAHVRKYQKRHGHGYYQHTLTLGQTPEVMLRDIVKMSTKPGRLRAGLDGSSESIRMKYGKKITNQDLVDAIVHCGNLAADNTAVVITLYTINNFPGETQQDRQELEDILMGIPDLKGRVVVVLCGLGFRPMPLTPLQYHEAGLFPSLVTNRQRVVRESGNLRATWSYTLEGPLSTLRNVLVERCDLANLKQVRTALMRDPASDSDTVAKAMIKQLKLENIIGTKESLPTDFLSVG